MAHSGPYHVVDCRHQKGGQIRLFGRPGSGLIANVLRSGPNPAGDAQLLATAPKMLNALRLFASQCPVGAESIHDAFGFAKGFPLAEIARRVAEEADGALLGVRTMAPDTMANLVAALDWALGQLSEPTLVRGQNDRYVAAWNKAQDALDKGRGL